MLVFISVFVFAAFFLKRDYQVHIQIYQNNMNKIHFYVFLVQLAFHESSLLGR